MLLSLACNLQKLVASLWVFLILTFLTYPHSLLWKCLCCHYRESLRFWWRWERRSWNQDFATDVWGEDCKKFWTKEVKGQGHVGTMSALDPFYLVKEEIEDNVSSIRHVLLLYSCEEVFRGQRSSLNCLYFAHLSIINAASTTTNQIFYSKEKIRES